MVIPKIYVIIYIYDGEKPDLFRKCPNIFFLVDQRGTAHELLELSIKERKAFIPAGIGNLTDLHICFNQHFVSYD